MKQTTRTSRAAGYLEKMFRALNQDFFNGEVDEPVITIQSKSDSYGHVTVLKTWDVKGEKKHELNISSRYMTRPIDEVVATMLHEMVHLWNLKNNIQDCSRGNTYHNKKFRDKATEIGLNCEHHDKYGWTMTSASEKIIDYIISKGWTELDMTDGNPITWTGSNSGGNGSSSTGKPIPVPGTNTKTKSNSIKYKCPLCRNSVRATKKVNVMCADCMELMIEDFGKQMSF